MKYLAIAEHCFLDVPTGASRVAWDMLNLMQRQGHETALICQRAGSMQPLGWHQEAGVQVFRFERKTLPIWHPGRLTAIIDAGRAAGRAASAGRRWDVVHVHAPVIGLGALDGISGAHRVISTIHSPSAAEQVINWRDQGAIGQLKTILGRNSLKIRYPPHDVSAHARDCARKTRGKSAVLLGGKVCSPVRYKSLRIPPSARQRQKFPA